MPRFFVNPDNVTEDKIIIEGGDAYHLARSLRMAVGDKITVSDGEGGEFFCTLTKIRDEECVCEIIERKSGGGEPPVKISLFMAYPKGDKLETIIQKSVELGASEIHPFESSRCIKRPKAEKADKQLARLSRISKEAAKQCGRAFIPKINAPISFSQMIEKIQHFDRAVFCYENENGRTLKSELKNIIDTDSVAVIVGSEGGFSSDEAKQIISAGAASVSLGERILRCETAPLFVLSSIAYELEL